MPKASQTDHDTAFPLPLLVVLCGVLFCLLGFVWALYGFLPGLAAAFVLDRLFRRIPSVDDGLKPTE